MKTALLTIGGLLFVLVVVDLIVARRKRRMKQAEVSPEWLVENTYDQDGDPWK